MTGNAKRTGLRALLLMVYGLAAIGTPPAYMHLATGILGGLQGLGSGHLQGVLLSAFSILALFGVWTLWSIGKRLWINCRYAAPDHRPRSNDAFGLICGWIAVVGFAALGNSLHRGFEVVVFSVLLVPALVLATAAFAWGKRDSQASPATVPRRAGLRLADLPGVIVGIASAAVGVAYYVPRPFSGWGACTWSVIFPMAGSLWPTERMEMFDGCNDDLTYLTYLCGSVSIVCLLAGAIAGAAGKHAAPLRGALATTVVVGFVLTALTLSAPWFDLLPTLFTGVAALAGTAWLGYLGGQLGAFGVGRMRRASPAHA